MVSLHARSYGNEGLKRWFRVQCDSYADCYSGCLVSPEKNCYSIIIITIIVVAYLWAWQSSNPVQYSTLVVHSTVPFQKSSPPNSYTHYFWTADILFLFWHKRTSLLSSLSIAIHLYVCYSYCIKAITTYSVESEMYSDVNPHMNRLS